MSIEYCKLNEHPFKKWTCTKEQLQDACHDFIVRCNNEVDNIMYHRIPELVEMSAYKGTFDSNSIKLLQLYNKQKAWEVEAPTVIRQQLFQVLVGYCEQPLTEPITVKLEFPSLSFTETHEMVDLLAKKINCIVGYDVVLDSTVYFLRTELTTYLEREMEPHRTDGSILRKSLNDSEEV